MMIPDYKDRGYPGPIRRRSHRLWAITLWAEGRAEAEALQLRPLIQQVRLGGHLRQFLGEPPRSREGRVLN